MKQLTLEEKAKAYDEALEKARQLCVYPTTKPFISDLQDLFPELHESEDEKIRKELVDIVAKSPITFAFEDKEKVLAWLEKQKTSEEAMQYLKENHSLSEVSDFQTAMNIAVTKAYDKGVKDGLERQGKQTNEKSLEDDIRRRSTIQVLEYAKSIPDYNQFGIDDIDKNIAWLENQIENNKPLYIRFGDVPKDEISKVYNGEIEIGTEKGVSVYPAFEDLDGNIVLGLSLPITKTSLYTQQHLLEYDNRPCYLVSGDYVGKGTDGEPLLRNVKIIREIKNFRVKQDEQKPQGKSALETIKEEKVDDSNKVEPKFEPKFEVGKWIVWQDKCYKVYDNSCGYELLDKDGFITSLEYGTVEINAHLWTIQAAKDGDVLTEDSCIFIIEKLNPNGTAIVHCCLFDDGDFDLGSTLGFDVNSTHPATKEQRGILSAKMKEAGYEWDAKKKELKKIEQKPIVNDESVINILNKENQQVQQEDLIMKPSLNTEQKWSEEDEKNLEKTIWYIEKGGKLIFAKTDKLVSWLKSLRPQKQWKPNEAQIEALKDACDEHWEPDGLDPLYTLYQELKKLREE